MKSPDATWEDRVVFAATMESAWRALSPLTPEERSAFLAAGITGDEFAAAYPVKYFFAVLDAAAQSRFGHLPEDERYAEIGRLIFAGFTGTLVGRALSTFMRVLGPARTLQRMTRNFRSTNNYVETSTEVLGDGHHRLHLDGVLRPGFYVGLLSSGLAVTGARNARVTQVAYAGDRATYEIRWD